MLTLKIRPAKNLQGITTVPGDKSISHRALILGMLAKGHSEIRGWLPAGDTLATLEIVRALGIDVQREGDTLSFTGGNLAEPNQSLDCINAGTAMRLLAGVMAGQDFPSILDGTEQLRKRPMGRITDPLREMGASISDNEGRCPLSISPEKLEGISYTLPMASAQVKSAVLLAGLFAEGETRVIEPGPTRDHTERMLIGMGVPVTSEDRTITLKGDAGLLQPLNMTVPGDISSAAFLIVAAMLVPSADIRIRNVGINSTRTGIIDALRRMGANIMIEDETDQGGEPAATLHIQHTGLSGTRIDGDEIVRAIDELPVIAVAATQAEGETVIAGAAEMRLKEVDRIAVMTAELRKMGAEIEERPDGMVIGGGGRRLHGASVDTHGDHRMGMALAIAGLVAEGETVITDADCIGDSYPGFAETLVALGAEVG